MTIKIIQGQPKNLYKEVSSIVKDCFEGIWSEKDLLQLLDLPHENNLFMVAYDDDKPVGYAFIVADYVESVDTKIATIQEIGVLPDYRESEVAEDFLEKAIQFSKANKAELLEQVVSTVDQWIIPTLTKKKLKPSEIKADREISSFNEAKLILTNIKKNTKITVLMNQIFFEDNDDLETHIVENEEEIDSIKRNDPIAFGSIISIDKAEDLEKTLNEIKKLDIEWDEIGITFDYML
ncbi:MAG: GNAT family N-acetyltransferase [Candidatus Heimdallarchaeota archaeon]|nr:GNAT family N-acetyltransferase [Candidatus Heimdallarchaeota archaeon]MBY8992990.1 GNAT family N-acetyltransferase [Candidatus Heimdallarchaeota archaeon]